MRCLRSGHQETAAAPIAAQPSLPFFKIEKQPPTACIGENCGRSESCVFGELTWNEAHCVMGVAWTSWTLLVPIYLVGTAGAFWFFQRVEIILEG